MGGARQCAACCDGKRGEGKGQVWYVATGMVKVRLRLRVKVLVRGRVKVWPVARGKPTRGESCGAEGRHTSGPPLESPDGRWEMG